jgi:multiple sugar transport system substrate-binding protein
MNMKKIILTVLALVLAGGMAFAGGGSQSSRGGQQAAGKTKVVMYTWWADAERAMGEALIADFEKAHPNIAVEQNYVAYNDYHSKINTMIASGSAPDVMYLNEFLINEWGEKGVTEDLYPHYRSAGIDPKTYYVGSALYITGGKLWGVNVTSTTIVLYYNKQMFRDAGITPPPESAASPWSWEQYTAAAKKLTKDALGKTPNDAGFNYSNLVQYGTVMPTSWIYVLPLLYAGGTSVANNAGTALEITSAAGIRVIQNIANLAAVDRVAPTVAMTNTNTVFSSLPAMLMNGQLGMFIGGTFQFSDFANEGYDVGIAQIPSMSGKGNNMVWSSGYTLRKGASKEAFDLFAYLVDFNNWVTASKNHNVGLTGLPQTTSVFSDSAKNAAWTAIFPADMARISGDILQNGSRLGENVTLKNFSEIMDQTIAPVLDKIWLGETTAQQALPPLNQVLGGKLQGVWN